jgi:Mrp family chromosome partitioning ATPase
MVGQRGALEREAKAQRDLFESYLAKYREATARDSIAAAPADARIISRAAASNIPYFPKKMPIVLIVAFATLCLSTAIVAIKALLSADTYRPVSIPAAPIAPPAALPRSSHARTRLTDRLPPAPSLPALQGAPPATPPQPTSATVDDIAATLLQAGEGGRRIAVIGSARNVGTTLTAIALARTLARHARVVLVDLALGSPNIDVISNDPAAPGIADLVHGTASFGDIITRDRASRAHVVAAGQVGNDAAGLVRSQMLWAAVGALAQSYDYLVIDAGAQSETAVEPIIAAAPFAVLVGGESPGNALNALALQLKSAGFAEVAVVTGPPPALDHAAVQTAA